MPFTVSQISGSDQPQWDEFVRRHPHGTPFHLTAWRDSIEGTFGYRPLYLAATEGATVRAVLPLFLVKNFLVGKALVSSPFAVYGGILADSPEAREALASHVRALAESLEVDYVELRNWQAEQCAGFTSVSRYVTFMQRIGPDQEAILEAIPRKTRYMVRKALRHAYSTRRQTSDFLAFEALYAENLRRLGTPSFPPRHFHTLLQNFRGHIDIRETVLEGSVVAAVMSFYFQDRVLPYYGASDPGYHDLAPNNYMYFDLMRWAGQNGYRTFDFGRSKKNAGGSYDFKAHWGMQMTELPYEVLLVKRKQLPHYSPNNPRFRMAIRVWQNLPLPITRVLGPPFLRLVP